MLPLRAFAGVPKWLARLVAAAGLVTCPTVDGADSPELLRPQVRPVGCGEVVCGSMEISWYRRFHDDDAIPRRERNGVNIRGRFRGIREQAREFHYLQALTRFEADDFRWRRDTGVPLPVRFVDPPPFGMQRPETDAVGRFRLVEQGFDALPWFDEGDFPLFEDRPRAFLASARRHGSVRMEFETWLVCVISAQQGADREQAADDRYEVAALVGWTWGYAITWRDVGEVGVDEFEDYAFDMLPLRFVPQPSQSFETALGATFGSAVTDRFHIRLGEAQQCPLR
jgi:hypothetical protein